MRRRSDHVDFISVGVVQTTIDADLAWLTTSDRPQISDAQDAHVWQEICKAMKSFMDGDRRPKFVLFPELSLPRTRMIDFEKLVCAVNAVVIIGADYKLDDSQKQARNEGIVFVPKGFWDDTPSKHCVSVKFGKSFGAPKEKAKLADLTPSWQFVGDENVYIFDAEKYGRIGVSICYDFMDLERALLYRSEIHHLFVLAYNRDLEMFKSLADSLSRTVYCNVIICNTGYHGGSTAVSPYFEAYRRTLYSHNGRGLFTTQVIELPVKGIEEALQGKMGSQSVKKTFQMFKDPPPGVPDSIDLHLNLKTLNLP